MASAGSHPGRACGSGCTQCQLAFSRVLHQVQASQRGSRQRSPQPQQEAPSRDRSRSPAPQDASCSSPLIICLAAVHSITPYLYRRKQQSSQLSELVEAHVSTTVSWPLLMEPEHCVNSRSDISNGSRHSGPVTHGQQVEISTRSTSGTVANHSVQQLLQHSMRLSASESHPCARTSLRRLQQLLGSVRTHTKM